MTATAFVVGSRHNRMKVFSSQQLSDFVVLLLCENVLDFHWRASALKGVSPLLTVELRWLPSFVEPSKGSLTVSPSLKLSRDLGDSGSSYQGGRTNCTLVDFFFRLLPESIFLCFGVISGTGFQRGGFDNGPAENRSCGAGVVRRGAGPAMERPNILRVVAPT